MPEGEVYCKVCEQQLGPPDDEIDFPESDLDQLDNPSGHIKIVVGDRGARFHCRDLGQMTSIVDGNGETIITASEYLPDGLVEKHMNGGGSGGSQDEPVQETPPDRGLDLEEQPEPLDLLNEVLSNPLYELSDPQVQEVMSWAQEFDNGQIPPNSLEEILGLLEGVSKQKASLMRQKYELKINRWMKKRSAGNKGPPIGGMARAGSQSTPNISSQIRQQQQQNKSSQKPQLKAQQQSSGSSQIESRSRRPNNPQERLNKRRAKAERRVDEFLDQFARNVGDDVGSFYGDIKQVVKVALMNKAEQDPDWVIEKLENVGGFDLIQEIMEPSDAKQQQQQQTQSSQSGVDREVEQAMQNVESNKTETHNNQQVSGSDEQPKRQESTQSQEDNPLDELMDEPEIEMNEVEETDEEEKEFEQVFGELASEQTNND